NTFCEFRRGPVARLDIEPQSFQRLAKQKAQRINQRFVLLRGRPQREVKQLDRSVRIICEHLNSVSRVLGEVAACKILMYQLRQSDEFRFCCFHASISSESCV